MRLIIILHRFFGKFRDVVHEKQAGQRLALRKDQHKLVG